MSVPVHVSRPAALALGFAAVCGTSLLVPDPLTRTFLIWVGFLPVLWALRRVHSGRESGARAPGPRPGEPGPIAIEAFGRLAQRLDAQKGGGGGGGGGRPAAGESGAVRPAGTTAWGLPPQAPGAAGAPAGRSAPPGAGSTAARRAGSTTAPAGGGPPYPVQRRYHGLRRLTEQYLREVRRMNLIAVWGREGSIPRRQALDQLREIEGRMRGLSERMKFVAGRARN